jgi:hypothetical protein
MFNDLTEVYRRGTGEDEMRRARLTGSGPLRHFLPQVLFVVGAVAPPWVTGGAGMIFRPAPAHRPGNRLLLEATA